MVYFSYPPGTVGYPADLPVELRAIDLPDGAPRTLVALPGGQGTINVRAGPGREATGVRLYPFAES
jgi:hypothetical protein